ncbi:hypothetical protein SAMN06265349_104110 [Flavobacterium resistens]|uniref:DUF4142 domain-containing protein n=1 Tax=Flavobacterium resistens TaxID=443612 RepID=A0A521E580_9FLAO|nr:hypothetical protein [Flavobacterium resistens]MRX69204.1 hypothetical protein [Flavobacterium resistens]SMO79067.1 hypothetical protein SAMN06265349_104110 [Flavobacterium resistens]
MKKTILFFLIIFSFAITSCNQQTLETYNNTIVRAHQKLLFINDNFYEKATTYIGKPESKKLLADLIEETKRKVIEDRKAVENLVPFKDHGLRRTILEMYSSTENAMFFYAANTDLITKTGNAEKAFKLFEKPLSEFRELDQLIRELQVQYAYYNKGQLR